ncbi:MAG: hypothetical protein AAF517_11450, partial [Planctomycetota bacterium]
QEVTSELGEDIFVKPAKLGSSVGIYHVTNQSQFEEASHSPTSLSPSSKGIPIVEETPMHARLVDF